MSLLKACDLCETIIEFDQVVEVSSRSRKVTRKDYCFDCWSNQANWQDMHYISTLGDNFKQKGKQHAL